MGFCNHAGVASGSSVFFPPFLLAPWPERQVLAGMGMKRPGLQASAAAAKIVISFLCRRPDGTIEARDAKQGVVDADGVSARDRETRRIAVLCGLEGDVASLGRYGPGSVRTVESFFERAGVDMRKLTIAEFAHAGKFWALDQVKDRRPWDWLAEGRVKDRPCGQQVEFRHKLTDRTMGMLRECADALEILPEQALATAMREWTEDPMAGGRQ